MYALSFNIYLSKPSEYRYAYRMHGEERVYKCHYVVLIDQYEITINFEVVPKIRIPLVLKLTSQCRCRSGFKTLYFIKTHKNDKI